MKTHALKTCKNLWHKWDCTLCSVKSIMLRKKQRWKTRAWIKVHWHYVSARRDVRNSRRDRVN